MEELTLILRRDETKKAVEILKRGGLVAFPTETVYGLGAVALNKKAVRSIFKAKGRPADNPLIVHISSRKQLKILAKKPTKKAEKLMKKFWPGPLTLIFEKTGKVPKEVTAGLSTVAVRMPANKTALSLIRQAGPIAAPSANSSGKPSPTDAEHVIEDLSGRIDAVIDGGKARIGVESTVLDMTTEPPTLLRPGGATLQELEKEIGKIVTNKRKNEPAKSPGMKYRHYAPNAQLILVTGSRKKTAAKIIKLAERYKNEGKKVRVIKFKSGKEAARELFRKMRQYDNQKADIILAMETSEEGLGLAVMNRLKKASSKTIKA